MKWIPLSERKPTREDGDQYHCVLSRGPSGVSQICSWDYVDESRHTHWSRIRDIELPPPPPPVMPERIEFKRLPRLSVAIDGDLLLDGQGMCHQATTGNTYNATPLYRRVEPGKRIVLEVGEKKAPEPGEWYLTYPGGVPCFCVCDCPGRGPRTILRLVEGEEYLK